MIPLVTASEAGKAQFLKLPPGRVVISRRVFGGSPGISVLGKGRHRG